MTQILLKGVAKTFPRFSLGPVDFEVKSGEFFGIFGPPSSGKTSILKAILGLLPIDGGMITFDGQDTAQIPVESRNVAMVFQNLSLFPHMTGRENIIYPLIERNFSKDEIERRLAEVAEVLHISHILHKNPSQMSGGERQRIGLGRAFIGDSRAILMDEPIAALDARLREEMRVELKRLQREKNQTFIYVSHDEEEVLAISDRVAVIIDGKIEQVGTPAEVYDQPANMAVARLIGSPPMNFFKGRGDASTGTFSSNLFNATVQVAGIPSGEVTLGVRPEDLHLSDSGIAGKVLTLEPLGSYTIINAEIGGQPVKIRASGQVSMAEGTSIHVSADTRHIHIFGPDGNKVG
jgi:ABC-type sugar transport system ATPase subunit